jgi:ankyrin repeat protein
MQAAHGVIGSKRQRNHLNGDADCVEGELRPAGKRQRAEDKSDDGSLLFGRILLFAAQAGYADDVLPAAIISKCLYRDADIWSFYNRFKASMEESLPRIYWNHRTPLMAAVQSSNFDRVIWMLENCLSGSFSNHRSLVDAQDCTCTTALLLAVKKGRHDMVDVLLQKGRADPNVKNGQGKTALHLTCAAGDVEMCRLFFQANALGVKRYCDPNLPDYRGVTPWGEVQPQADRRAAIYSLLLDHGARPEGGAFSFACSCKDEALCLKLIEKGFAHANRLREGEEAKDVQPCDPLDRPEANEWPLLMALEAGLQSVATALLERTTFGNGHEWKPDPNIGVNCPHTPLHIAIEKGFDHALVRKLVERGALVNARARKNGKAPLWLAIQDLPKQASTVRLLVEQGADCNLNGDDTTSALRLALSLGEDEETTLLILERAIETGTGPVRAGYRRLDIDHQHKDAKDRLINSAASGGLVKAVKRLVEAGADPLIPSQSGETPLFAAVKSGKAAVAMYFLDLIEERYKSDSEGLRSYLDRNNSHRPGELLQVIPSTIKMAGSEGMVAVVERLLRSRYPGAKNGDDVVAIDALLNFLQPEETDTSAQQKKRRPSKEELAAKDARFAAAVQILAPLGASAYATGRKGKSCLHLAVSAELPLVAKTLLGLGPTVLLGPPLLTAVKRNNAELVSFLLQAYPAGKDRFAAAKDGLLRAVELKLEELGLLLFEECSMSVAEGPLLAAAVKNDMWTLARKIFDEGSDPLLYPARDKEKLLVLAMERGQEAFVLDLLQRGFEPYPRFGQATRQALRKDNDDDDNEVSDSYSRRPYIELTGALATAIKAGMATLIKPLFGFGFHDGRERVEDTGESYLHLAVKSKLDNEKRLKVVKALLAAGCSPLACDRGGRTVIHDAVAHSSADVVSALLEAAGTRFNAAAIDARGNSVLAELLESSQGAPVLKALLATGKIDVNATVPAFLPESGETDINLRSPLLVEFCRAGDQEAALLVLEQPACNYNARGGWRDSPALVVAIQQQLDRVVDRLLASDGIDVNCSDSIGCTPLMEAGRNADAEIVRALLAKGAKLEVRDGRGRRAIHLAAAAALKADALVALLDANCKIDSRDLEGRSALLYALECGPAEAARELLARKAVLVGIRDDLELNAACERDGTFGEILLELFKQMLKLQCVNEDVATYVLAALIRMQREDLALGFVATQGTKALSPSRCTEALENGMTKLALAILNEYERGATSEDSEDWRPEFTAQLPDLLLLACEKGVVSFVRAVIATFNRHVTNFSFKSDGLLKTECFTVAAGRGDVATLKALLSFGSVDRWPSLFERVLTKSLNLAIECCNTEAALYLLEHVATNPNGDGNTDLWSKSPLTVAVEKGLSSVVKRLLERGADTAGVTVAERRTALQLAAEKFDVRCAETLLAAGADVNAMEQRTGYTPLHASLLARTGGSSCLPMVSLLLRHNANPNITSEAGRESALAPAVREGNYGAVSRILRESKVPVDLSIRTFRNVTVFESVFTSRAESSRIRLDIAELLALFQTITKFESALVLTTMMYDSDRYEPVKYLLSLGADPNERGALLCPSPLWHLCANLHREDLSLDDLELIRLLLEDYQADPTLRLQDFHDRQAQAKTIIQIIETTQLDPRLYSWRKVISMLKDAEARILRERVAEEKAPSRIETDGASAGAGGGARGEL